ncbi:MAG TPA: 4-hydroxy-2-oxovalerate aldolase [Candidatus Sulfotelmatobacter sp.]|nr:4-hydroxy-2-oxovalerate aldolase [Candidatus Sulfotelmatobacter sp.]
MADLHLLECTLRDGSYVIDFQFTERDTMIIAAALENAGIEMIEIGHGVGLNASAAGKGKAAATDEAYLRAAAKTLKRARWGMFFIPGVGRHEDLDMAASYGMHFVRVGTNASEVEGSREYIEHAKRLGMFVSANLMKSYTMPPAELAEQGSLSAQFGADVVCVVDSAGGMMPEDVRAYIQAMRGAIDVPVGFHGHDNLSLGIANVLAAIEAGATYVDSTLRGMGRGGGNPATEILVTVLKKRGIDLGVDLNRLMDLSERMIKPMLPAAGIDPIDITSGYAQFHSSFLKTILKYADSYGVDPRDLIVAVCEVDQTYAPDDLVEDIAKRLQAQSAAKPKGSSGALDIHVDVSAGETTPATLAQQVRTEAKKRGKRSVINIVAAQRRSRSAAISPFIQEEFDYVIGSLEIGDADQVEPLIREVDGIVDVLLVDANPREFLPETLGDMSRRIAQASRVFTYSDAELWARTVMYELKALPTQLGAPVVIVGLRPEATHLAAHLADQGIRIILSGAPSSDLDSTASALRALAGKQSRIEVGTDLGAAAAEATALAAFHTDRPLIDREVMARVSPEAIIFDATIGSVEQDAIELAVQRGIRIIRPDMRAAMAGELAAQLGTAETTHQLMGRGEIAGYPVVAGGLIGALGDVVVDSISKPTRVVGIADGRGRLLASTTGYDDRVRTVESALAGRQALLQT